MPPDGEPPPPLVFISRSYWPESTPEAQTLAELAETLAARGHEVSVVCGRPSGPRRPARESRAGVSIWRGGRGGPRVGWAAGWRAVRLLAGLWWNLARAVRPGTVVIALTDFPAAPWLAWAVARRNRARLFHWIQEIQPEVALTAGGARGLHLLRPWRNRSWRAAEGCACAGEDLVPTLLRAGVPVEKVVVLTPWAPRSLLEGGPEATPPAPALAALGDKFVILVPGTWDGTDEFPALLRLATALRARPDILFVGVGDGPRRGAAAAQARAAGLGNVVFLPTPSAADLPALLARAAVHLLTLRGGCEAFRHPAHLSLGIGAGRAIVFLGARDSALARLIEDHGFGCAFEPCETAAIARTLAGFASEPGTLRSLAAAATAFALKSPHAAGVATGWETIIADPAGFHSLSPARRRRVPLRGGNGH